MKMMMHRFESSGVKKMFTTNNKKRIVINYTLLDFDGNKSFNYEENKRDGEINNFTYEKTQRRIDTKEWKEGRGVRRPTISNNDRAGCTSSLLFVVDDIDDDEEDEVFEAGESIEGAEETREDACKGREAATACTAAAIATCCCCC